MAERAAVEPQVVVDADEAPLAWAGALFDAVSVALRAAIVEALTGRLNTVRVAVSDGQADDPGGPV